MKHRAQITYIQRALLHVAPQLRKIFAPGPLEDFSRDIEIHGIQSPLMVRPRPDGGEGYELVYGERRLRATDLLLDRVSNPEDYVELPCIIRDLTDVEALEEQLIENLSREQVTAREEAEGYVRMLALTDAEGVKIYPTQQSIADRIGKTRQHVKERLKLRLIHEALWDAYAEKKVQMAQLMLVGGVPHPRDREELGRKLIAGYAGRPYTWRETEALVLGYRRSLTGAPFDAADAVLVPEEWKDDQRLEGGACTDCPHRTGNDITVVGGDPQLCCNPRCFEKKVNIGWRVIRKSAEDEGRAVIDVDGADRFFDGSGNARTDGIYVDLATSPDMLSVGHYGVDEVDVWNALLTDTVAFSESLVVRHPQTLKVHYFLERDRAVELASENGHGAVFAKRIVKRDKGKGVRDKEEGAAGGGVSDFIGKAKADRKTVDSAPVDGKTVNPAVARRAMVDELCAIIKPGVMGKESGYALVRLCLTLCACEKQAPVLEFCGAIVDEKTTMKEPELWAVVETKIDQDIAGDSAAWLRYVIVFLALGEWSLLGGEAPSARRLIEALKIPAEPLVVDFTASPFGDGVPASEVSRGGAESAEEGVLVKDLLTGKVNDHIASLTTKAVVIGEEAKMSPEEKIAFATWVVTGSLKKAGEDSAQPLNTCRTWSRRHDWKGLKARIVTPLN